VYNRNRDMSSSENFVSVKIREGKLEQMSFR
jgi:hypothetical protein